MLEHCASIPLEVTPRLGESSEKMIRRFIKKVRLDGVLREHFVRQSYDKPSMKKRKKRMRTHSFAVKVEK